MKKYLIIIVWIASLFSCIDDEEWFRMNTPPTPPQNAPGLFIINEGNFMYDNASLSFYAVDSMKCYNHVFYGTNEIPLGDVATSMTINDSIGYVVVNNSGKVYAFNINTFEYLGKITGLTSPRYMHFVNDEKAYISDLYAKSIAIVNPTTFEISGYIDVQNHQSNFYQHPTEQMLAYGDVVFTNCWSFDRTILVIDSQKDEVIDSIEVLAQPQSMVLDRYNKLWVLCDGGYAGNPFAYEEPGIVKIDAATRTIERIWKFSKEDSPSKLIINGSRDTLYYLNSHIYRKNVTTDTDPEIWMEGQSDGAYSGGFFGLAIDPVSSEIYVANAVDYIQRGSVYRFNTKAEAVDTFQVGISPGNFCFKPTQ